MQSLNKIKKLFKELGINTNNNRAYYYYDIYQYFLVNKVNKNNKIAEFGHYSNEIIKKLISPSIEFKFTHLKYPDYDLLDLSKIREKFDIIILDQILEHLQNPFIAAEKLWRILNNNGIIICSTDFMYPLHYTNPNTKNDFFRYSSDGLKQVFYKYKPEFVKMYGNLEYIQFLAKNNWFKSGPYDSSNNLYTTNNRKFYEYNNEDYGVSVLGIMKKVTEPSIIRRIVEKFCKRIIYLNHHQILFD